MPINEQYFNDIADQLDRVDVCPEIQVLLDRVFQEVQTEIDSLAEQAGVLIPIAELVALAITDLPSVLTFLQKLVTAVIVPYVAPYLKMVAELAETVVAMERVVTSAQAAAERVAGGCDLTIPTLDVPILPVL